MKRAINAHLAEDGRLRAVVVSDQGERLALIGDPADIVPEVEVDGVLAGNPALRSNLWGYAKAWYAGITLGDTDAMHVSDPAEQAAKLKELEETRQIARKRAASHARTAQWIADVADDTSRLDVLHGWCSSCFTKNDHARSNRPVGQVPVYVCRGCGTPTLQCVAPGCDNMATRDAGAIRLPRYCAEHRHEIPSFEKAEGTFGELHDYEDYLRYEKPNFDRTTKIVAGGAATLAVALPLAFVAAPAIGGALGSMGIFGGLTGAAATSHGLALLGGGSLAAGGLGMVGGTAVVTVVGGAVGSALGASVANAYLRQDSSFRIDLLRPGNGGVPVLVANGFLTDHAGERWGGWRRIVDERYPDSPVYRVLWGAKELADLAVFSRDALTKAGGLFIVKGGAKLAAKAGARFLGNVIGPAMLASDLAKNPWHVAKDRADKTGVILGDLLARTEASSYVLIGHSLGARAMVVAAETVGTAAHAPRIQTMHLLGAAIGAKSDWSGLTASVDEAVFNYHSERDSVLQFLYRVAQGGATAAGLTGLRPASDKIANIDVSDEVGAHSEYQDNVTLR